MHSFERETCRQACLLLQLLCTWLDHAWYYGPASSWFAKKKSLEQSVNNHNWAGGHAALVGGAQGVFFALGVSDFATNQGEGT